jgi:hypothetical protein
VSLVAGGLFAFGLLQCKGETKEPKPVDERFVGWAKKRADRDLESFQAWALAKGLKTSAAEVNMRLAEYGQDVGHECGQDKPAPENGLCSGAHRDASGWVALMRWKADDPEASSAIFMGYARAALSCTDLGADELGQARQESDTGVVVRRCRLQSHQMLTQQATPYDPSWYAWSRIAIYSERLIQVDPDTAELLRTR